MAKAKYKTLKEANKALPPATAEVFEIVSFSKRTSFRFVCTHGEVNIKTLSVRRADQLIQQGASFIKRKPNDQK